MTTSSFRNITCLLFVCLLASRCFFLGQHSARRRRRVSSLECISCVWLVSLCAVNCNQQGPPTALNAVQCNRQSTAFAKRQLFPGLFLHVREHCSNSVTTVYMLSSVLLFLPILPVMISLLISSDRAMTRKSSR